MCGLFGFYGPSLDGPTLAWAAVLASRRGPDAWGVSDARGLRKGLQRLPAEEAGKLTGKTVIGHCRLSTVLGTSKNLSAAQPLTYGGMTVAHNGAVFNLGGLGLALRTDNDSEAWLALMLSLPGNLRDRYYSAADHIEDGGHHALAVAYEGEVLLAAKGNMPLFRYRDTDDGLYWTSVSPGKEWKRLEGTEHAQGLRKSRDG